MIRFFGYLFSGLSLAAIFGLGGLAALVWIYDRDLPSHTELSNYQPKMLSRVYSGDGEVIAEFAHERRLFAPIDEIPDLVKQAFISAEDKNFYAHAGVDPVGMAKAMVRFGLSRSSGDDAQLSGASTITQQVMKNFLVGNERSFERKIKEGILAVRIDGTLTKDQILELYLNDIFFGARAYGVVAAAQNYFGKTLEALAPEEVAYLAALPKAPSALHPIRDHDRAIARRNYVLEEMAQNGVLAREAAEAAKARPLATLLDRQTPSVLGQAKPNYFTEEVRRQMIAELGQDRLYDDGLSIRATIETDLQATAGVALRRALAKFDRSRGVYRGPFTQVTPGADWRAVLAGVAAPRDIPEWRLGLVLEVTKTHALVGIEGAPGDGTGRVSLEDARKWVKSVGRAGPAKTAADLWSIGDVVFVEADGDKWYLRQIPEIQGGFMAMDPHTGRVLAIQGGFSHDLSVFNRATQALRQPGSSFKPFVYAAALDAGFTPATVVLDAPIVVRTAGVDWRPKNSTNKFYGPSPLRTGLEQSRNLMTVRLAQQIGMDRIADYAERFGVYTDMPHHLSYSLGAGETTLYQMVAAYGMFANGGKRVQPTLVDRIQDRNGATLYRHDPRVCQGCKVADFGTDRTPLLFDRRSQIMNPVTASQIVSIMEGVVTRGTAKRTVGGLGFPVAGKTGTTNESRDAWFVGFSPNIVAGCYIGYDTPRPMGKNSYGGTLCGPVFREFMAAAMLTRAPGEFIVPLTGGAVTIKVDRNTGERLPDDAVGDHVQTEIFQMGSEPEIHAAALQIAGDQELFGSYGGDLPFSLPEGEDLPASGVGDAGTGGADLPARPKPPANVGMGTGGLY